MFCLRGWRRATVKNATRTGTSQQGRDVLAFFDPSEDLDRLMRASVFLKAYNAACNPV